MTKNINTQPTPESATLNTWIEGKPFAISGDYEAVADQLPRADKYIKHMAGSAAVSHVEAPVAVPEPKEQYLNLGTLEPRQEARMALRALAWDIRTLGRNNEYRRFKQRVAEEKALAMDMELGLVQRVHCRLHERMLKG